MSVLMQTLQVLNKFAGVSRPQAALFHLAARNDAARKGTREKARKKKVKVEVVKQGFIPHNQRGLEQMLLSRKSKKYNDSWKQVTTDNVYPMKYYQWKIYPFAEAVQCHRETHHPTMYNEPDAPLNVIIELDMQGEKKTRFVDNFNRVVAIPHPFEHGEERNVLVFTKDQKLQDEARNAGAGLVGGPELIKEFQTGAISLQDFHYVIAHPHILPELVALRGLMKKKFPNPKNGSLSVEVVEMVNKFVQGINYTAKKEEYEKDFGLIETSVGKLSMDPKHLEENFEALIKDVQSAKPKRPGDFIRRCLLASPPCSEKLKVDHNLYIESKEKQKKVEEESDDEEIEMKATA